MNNSICPWWMGYALLNPIRKLVHDPVKILSPYVKKEMSILEIGCGMGFFSIPIANIAGKGGYVLSVDLQEKMLKALTKRIKKANPPVVIETHQCSVGSLNIDNFANKFDFTLAFAVVHEIPDQDRLFKEIYAALKDKGLLLIAEPKGHVDKKDLEKYVFIATKEGFTMIDRPKIKSSHSILLKKII